jgi:hypothetical protein
LLIALGILLLSALAMGGAFAQSDKDDKWTLKPLIPPVFQLPPNAQVKPGEVTRTPGAGDAGPTFNNPQSQSPPAPGMRITIPR